MKNYVALLNGNTVAEIIVGEYEWVENNLPGEWHDLGPEPLQVAVGWTYDPSTGKFSPPPRKPIPED